MNQKRCRRGHKLTGDNITNQKNYYTTVAGKRRSYVTKVCLKCRRFRYTKHVAGEMIVDWVLGEIFD